MKSIENDTWQTSSKTLLAADAQALENGLQAEAEPWGLDPLDKTFWGMATAPGQMSQRELSRTLDESAHHIRRSGVCKFRIARTKFLKLLTC